ncbi:MAG: carotenoid oxygenase family protein [Acidimicrobiia bacterium]|nr:carotenoid oxygenase family protein [Acidimicrobiia bacterium]MDH5237227.1 carotenoid oxygenase family protein [Acidimicrobiia bacterium]
MTSTEVELDPRGQGPDAPWHVIESRAPVFDEVTVLSEDLEVVGSIPPELNGRYIRNTANPQTGWTEHWFIGDGMLHGIELANGKATWYRNRYVRTPQYAHPGADRLELALDMETFTFDHSVSAANTHIIGHGDRILALEEGSFPYEVTPELDTVGPHTFGGALTGPFTAHPKFCPDTGEMLGFGYAQVEPFLTYYRVSPDGSLVQSTPITVTGPTMMHDFAASRNHAIFMDLPAIFDMELAMNGGMPIRWSDDYPPRFGVMPREGGDGDVQWFDVEPSYCFHTLNAFDEGDETVVYGFRVPEIWRESAAMDMSGEPDPAGQPRLYEWRLDRASGKVSERYLDDASGEFPRIAEAVQGHPFRYGYSLGVTGVEGSSGMGGAVYKYDLANGASKEVHRFPAGHENGETVFVPAEGGTNEDDGYLMTYVWKPETDTSYLAILDASNVTADPIAEVHIPRRVVAGFHSSWIPDAR